jgi:hypothetical protein
VFFAQLESEKGDLKWLSSVDNTYQRRSPS